MATVSRWLPFIRIFGSLHGRDLAPLRRGFFVRRAETRTGGGWHYSRAGSRFVLGGSSFSRDHQLTLRLGVGVVGLLYSGETVQARYVNKHDHLAPSPWRGFFVQVPRALATNVAAWRWEGGLAFGRVRQARWQDTMLNPPSPAPLAGLLCSGGPASEVHTHTWGGMERGARTHRRGFYGLAIRSPLSVNFAGGPRRVGSPRVPCMEGGVSPALRCRPLARPKVPWRV